MIRKSQKSSSILKEEEKYYNDQNINLRLKNKKINMHRTKQPINSGS